MTYAIISGMTNESFNVIDKPPATHSDSEGFKKSEKFKKERLNTILQKRGIASRRKSDDLIISGKVKVNNKVITRPGHKACPIEDQILVAGRCVSEGHQKVAYILNKPKGFVCSHKGDLGAPTIYELFKKNPYRLFSAGRLDKDATGMLIVTNDGDLAYDLTHPSQKIEKEYFVKVREQITKEHINFMRRGIKLQGQLLIPKSVVKVKAKSLLITIFEGKKHEVKYFVRKAGLSLTELKRVRIGSLKLAHLPLGTFRELKEREKDLMLFS